MRRGFHTMFRKGLSMEIRKHMIFSGEVQGVGFRYTAYMAAGKLGLSGWVANLEDGSPPPHDLSFPVLCIQAEPEILP